jgi:dihydroorotate dehydrogenase
MIYEGPLLAARLKRDLAELLRADGFASIGEAVGKDAD